MLLEKPVLTFQTASRDTVDDVFPGKEEQDQLLTIEYMSDPDNPEKKELLFEIKV